jgi:hypothetical protein
VDLWDLVEWCKSKPRCDSESITVKPMFTEQRMKVC